MEVRRTIVRFLGELAEDLDVRCVVLTGSEKAFAAGADIREMAQVGAIEMMKRALGGVWDAVAAFSKPLTAAVSGYALGGGCEVAMHADIIIAIQNEKFGQPEVTIGILPGGEGTKRLTRAVGSSRQ